MTLLIVAADPQPISARDRASKPTVHATGPHPRAGAADAGAPRIMGAPGSRELSVAPESVTVVGDGGTSTVLGEVRNTSDSTVASAFVQVAAFDSAGNLLDLDRRSVPGIPLCQPVGSDWNLMRPGETSVFNAHLGCDADDIAEIFVRAVGFASLEEPCETAIELVGDWEIAEPWPGRSQLTGIVRNPNDWSIIDLGVTVVARDGSGAVAAVARDYPRGEIIGGYAGGLRSGSELEVSLSLAVSPAELQGLTLENRFTARPYVGGAFRYGVVGIAHSTGVNGSSWRTSLGLTNSSGAAARAFLTYHHGGGRAEAVLEIGDGESLLVDDVARTLFGVPGRSAGYLQITSSAPLALVGRTADEAGPGSFGQSLPVYTPEMTGELGFGTLPGLRGGASFRTNIGVVNMAGNGCSCRVRLFNPDGSMLHDLGDVDLDSTQWIQLNDVVPDQVDHASATVDPGQGCWVWAYASVIDETTGDPTTVEVEPATVIDLAPTGQRAGGWVMGGWADQEQPEPPH